MFDCLLAGRQRLIEMGERQASLLEHIFQLGVSFGFSSLPNDTVIMIIIILPKTVFIIARFFLETLLWFLGLLSAGSSTSAIITTILLTLLIVEQLFIDEVANGVSVAFSRQEALI